MIQMLRRLGLVLLLGVALFVTACDPGTNGAFWGPGSSQGDQSTEALHRRGGIVVKVFPEVLPAMEALLPVWRRLHPNIPLAFTSAPIINTASNANTFVAADVLVSDSEQVMNDAIFQGITRDKGIIFAATTLELALPSANPGNINRLQDTARPGLNLVHSTWSSGLAQYTQATLERMMRLPEFSGANIPCVGNYANCTLGNMSVTVTDGIAAGELLVDPSLATVPIPNNQLPLSSAFIYNTDLQHVRALHGPGTLTSIPVPTTFAPPNPLWCAIAAIQARNVGAARTFQLFLVSPEAQGVFRLQGYLPPTAAAQRANPQAP